MKRAIRQMTCAGCRLNRNGRCQDRAVYGPEGGDLLVGPGPRRCYEQIGTLAEGLSLYLLDHEGQGVKA